jgi:hypothetical protein
VNYAELTAAIKSYTENQFPETIGSGGLTAQQQIDIFIQQAEQRVYNAVQLLALRKDGTATTSIGNQTLATPADWLANYSVAVVDPVTGDYSFLLNKDVSFIREAFPNPSTTGTPTYYAMTDEDSYILGPTPNAAYTVAINYFYYPESIVTANTTWLGDNFDSVLLYGSLLEAYTFMKGEPDVTDEYQKRYDQALAMLKQLAEGKNRQDMFRTLQVRYPVR